MTTSDSQASAIERRIERLIIVLGVVAAVAAGMIWGRRMASGVALGAALSWLNFRWLRQGAAGVIRLGLAQAGAERVHIPKSLHAKFFGRIVLLLIMVYAILTWLRLPAAAVLCGLAAILPAIMIELGYEVIHGDHRWNEQ